MSTSNAQTRRHSVFSCFVTLAAIAAIVKSAGLAAEPPSLDEIKAHWATQRERVSSLYIEYQLDTEITVKPEVYVSLPPFESKIFLPKEETHFGFKGRKRYRRLIEPERPELLPPRQPPKVDPKASPFEQEGQKIRAEQAKAVEEIRANPGRLRMPSDETFAFDAVKAWRRAPRGAYNVFVHGRDTSLNWWQPKEYLACVGLGVPDPLEKSTFWQEQHRTVLMPDLLDARPYRVLGKTETVDGSECVVLQAEYRRTLPSGEQASEVSRDAIWLDLEHGLAIRQREDACDGLLHSRWINSALFEALPGFWLPKESQIQRFARTGAAEQYLNKPIEITKMRLTKWVVNDVPDDLFQLAIKPDDRVYDSRDPKWQAR